MVTLYSNLDYEQFILAYYHRFGSHGNYSFITNNCSDAVDFALDYFFPDKTKTECCLNLYKIVCCWLCIGTVGVRVFPVPVGINSPNDVFDEAKLLSWGYGEVPTGIEIALPAFNTSPATSTALSLAILNKETRVANYFVEKHLEKFQRRQLAYAYLCCVVTKNVEFGLRLKK